MRRTKFPVVCGTEHWPCSLLDMPAINIEVSPEMREKLDSSMKRIRSLAKDRDFCTNYGTRFTTVPRGQDE